ncbi:MAG: hypothetical protein HDS60_03815 [Barnesiella sp.]|nr:hypothetical protein [Barnesiella sp.]
MADRDPIAEREKFIEGWNKTMVEIWAERIKLLGIVDTGALLASPLELPVQADGRFYDITLSQTFLEYGLWQDLGTGREVPIGNPGDIGREKKRERRRWFSTKYYSSIMKLRDFMAESLGNEFKAMFCNALDADRLRHSSQYYRRKGLS